MNVSSILKSLIFYDKMSHTFMFTNTVNNFAGRLKRLLLTKSNPCCCALFSLATNTTLSNALAPYNKLNYKNTPEMLQISCKQIDSLCKYISESHRFIYKYDQKLCDQPNY